MLADAIIQAQTETVADTGGYPFERLPKQLAIFFDFASLCQKDSTGQRTPDEDAAFGAALDCMQIWYAHTATTVFLMTKQIDGSTALPYAHRGWPSFERSVAFIAKRNTTRAWPMIVDVGSGTGNCERSVPLTPDAFAALLDTVQFTNGADKQVVFRLYRETSDAVLGCSGQLSYNGLGWGDAEFKSLCAVLQICHKVERLGLSSNDAVTNDGLQALSVAIAAGYMPALKELTVLGSDGDPLGLKFSRGAGIRELEWACNARGIRVDTFGL